MRDSDTTAWIIAAGVAAVLIANGASQAQNTGTAGSRPAPGPIVLVDSTGRLAARPLNETIMLVSISSAGVAPALIRPVYDAEGRSASGEATWQAGGSVLYTSPDCTAGPHVHSSPSAGVRASTQVQTPAGIMLYVGAIGPAVTMTIRSILYDTGCALVPIRQNGLVPVAASVNLSTAYPPPLSFR